MVAAALGGVAAVEALLGFASVSASSQRASPALEPPGAGDSTQGESRRARRVAGIGAAALQRHMEEVESRVVLVTARERERVTAAGWSVPPLVVRRCGARRVQAATAGTAMGPCL